MKRPADQAIATLLLATVLVFGLFLFVDWFAASDPDGYYAASQEDELAEWATFWAFMVAAVLFARVALAARRAGRKVPWFEAGLALFCFVVAMEEISWAQRLVGYRPPDYFLAHNFQQELNLHNIVGTDWRKIGLKVVILGFGVVLPLLALLPIRRRWYDRLGIATPPLALVPAFAATYWVYETYPWRFAGEWVELALGLCFLFTAVLWLLARAPAGKGTRRSTRWPAFGAGATALVVLASLATTVLAHRLIRDRPEQVEAARVELSALAKDFRSGRVATRCGQHKRLYTFAEETRQDQLHRGAFAALQAGGLPESRADFLLDPWNSPYWVRHKCADHRRREVLFVYSFGPNRRRDSSEWEILGDDVGVVLVDRR